MATLHVRNLSDDLYQRLQAVASREQRSIGAEVVVLLEHALDQEALREQRMEALARIAKRRRSLPRIEGATDSLTLLREDRER